MRSFEMQMLGLGLWRNRKLVHIWILFFLDWYKNNTAKLTHYLFLVFSPFLTESQTICSKYSTVATGVDLKTSKPHLSNTCNTCNAIIAMHSHYLRRPPCFIKFHLQRVPSITASIDRTFLPASCPIDKTTSTTALDCFSVYQDLHSSQQ